MRYSARMRIASLSPAATEILYELGLQDQIVCTDQFSNFPESVQDVPHVKDMTKVHPDDLKPFEPDIVVLGTSIQQKLSEELQKYGYSVLFEDPRTVNDIYKWIRSIGTVFDRERESEDLIVSMQQGFNDVKKKGGLLPTKLKLYIEEWHNPPYASGNWVPEVVQVAGGQQFPVVPGELSPEVALEQVQDYNPDLIILSLCGAGSSVETSLLTEREGWDALRAVQEGNVKVIDDSLLNRPGPRLVEGAQRLYSWMFEMLH